MGLNSLIPWTTRQGAKFICNAKSSRASLYPDPAQDFAENAVRRLLRRAVPLRPVIFLHGVLRAIIPGQAVPEFEVPRHGVLGKGGGGKRQAERESGSRNSKRDAGADGHRWVFPSEATHAPVA